MDTIRKDMIEAKKAKNSLKANLLSTLFSEIFTLSKSGKELTEEDELKIIRKFLKNIDETLSFDIPESKKTGLENEKQILLSYLPKQLEIEEIENIVKEKIAEGKTMRDIMPFFKEVYNGRYDGKTVSEAVKKFST